MRRLFLVLFCAALLPLASLRPAAGQLQPAANLVVVSMDGMRWQEVFGGMQQDLLTKDAGGVSDAAPLERRFGAVTPEERRQKLMPFFWTTVARDGQIFGDPSRESVARLTNGLWFSYPGYSEMLSGFSDPKVDSNDRNWNPNVTVLEWLNQQPGYQGRVAAFASWELLPWILNEKRSGIPCNAAGPPVTAPATERERLINAFASELPPYWSETRFDAPTGLGALEYLRNHQPRVLYVMLGETDEWAHGRRYDLYLDSAQRSDRFIRQLWDSVQSMSQYANRTALVLATDHGRGNTAADWTGHGRKIPAAERIWMAVMGPGVPRLGIRRNVAVTQSQIAATIASLLGEDFTRAQPKAARPLDLGR